MRACKVRRTISLNPTASSGVEHTWTALPHNPTLERYALETRNPKPTPFNRRLAFGRPRAPPPGPVLFSTRLPYLTVNRCATMRDHAMERSAKNTEPNAVCANLSDSGPTNPQMFASAAAVFSSESRVPLRSCIQASTSDSPRRCAYMVIGGDMV